VKGEGPPSSDAAIGATRGLVNTNTSVPLHRTAKRVKCYNNNIARARYVVSIDVLSIDVAPISNGRLRIECGATMQSHNDRTHDMKMRTAKWS